MGGVGLGGQTSPELLALNGAHAIAAGAVRTDEDSNSLDLSVLDAINLNLTGLTGTLSTLLSAATDTPVGAINQYAFADQATNAAGVAEIGGAGAITDNGTLDLQHNGSSAPSLGQLHLRHVLAQLTGVPAAAALVSNITDLTLDIGVVAGRAQMDSIVEVPDPSEVTREYLLAYLHLLVESELVSALGTALSTASPVTIGVNAGPILDLLEGALGKLLSANIQVEATLDSSQVTGQIPKGDAQALTLNLEEGTIDIDVAPLLGHAFGGIDGSLNGLAPNSRLFVDVGLPAGGVGTLTEGLKDTLIERLGEFVSVQIDVSARIVVQVPVLKITGTLNELLSGEGNVQLMGGLTGNVPGSTLEAIGELVRDALSTLLDGDGLIAVALQGVNGLLESLFTVLSDPGILSLTVNAQNNSTGTAPAFYQGLPPGRFDVAALHLAVLEGADLLNLSLGRGSVGENTLPN